MNPTSEPTDADHNIVTQALVKARETLRQNPASDEAMSTLLTHLNRPEARAYVMELTDSPDPKLRKFMAHWLIMGPCWPRAIPVFLKLLDDPDASVASELIEYIRRWQPPIESDRQRLVEAAVEGKVPVTDRALERLSRVKLWPNPPRWTLDLLIEIRSATADHRADSMRHGSAPASRVKPKL